MAHHPISSTGISTFIFLAILIAGSISFNPGMGIEEPSRLSELVKFDILTTRIESDGVDGWPEFVVGRINRTTTITTRMVNRGDIPLSEVEITCTIYWYDGFYPDRGQVMFKDIVLVDVPPGDNQFSDYVDFKWVPSFSGSYMINISAHVPGDAREMSTDPLFFQGLKYEPISGSYFYSGVWVASDYWNCSDLKGWKTESNGAPVAEGWSSVKHPLSMLVDGFHSEPYCFWSGNRSTWKASMTGNHSLMSPPIDLSRFDPEPYDIERSGRRPQIFLLYRYRGNLSSNGPSGNGSLSHYISIDNGTTWEPLLDTKEKMVVTTGNTTGGKWDYSKRPFYKGNGHMVGLDLAAYQGDVVRIKLVTQNSGYNESGYLIDDFTVMGMDLVESVPFDLGLPSPDPENVDPGTVHEMVFSVIPRRTSGQFRVRFQPINSTGSINQDRDIEVDPGFITFSGEDLNPAMVSVKVSIPRNERSGINTILIRAIGGGITRDLGLSFKVKPRHDLISRLSDEVPDIIEMESVVDLDLVIENRGNIAEDVSYTFVTESQMIWNSGSGSVNLEPGQLRTIPGELKIANGTTSGLKTGFIIASIYSLPSDEEVLSTILDGSSDPSWKIHFINFTLKQTHSMEFVAMTSYRDIKDPPSNGTIQLNYSLFISNNGNGQEEITYMVIGTDDVEGMELLLPESTILAPDSSEVFNARLILDFPLSRGNYNLSVIAISGIEGEIKKEVELTLLIGSTPVSRGTYLLNGSLSIQKEEVVMGRETIIEFSSQSFGKPGGEDFEVGLLINGFEEVSRSFSHTIGGPSKHQMTWIFSSPGLHNVSIVLHGEVYPNVEELGLLSIVSKVVEVRFVDLSLETIIAGKQNLSSDMEPIEPGTYQFRSVVRNQGDGLANVFSLILEVIEVGEPTNKTVQIVNLTELPAGENITVLFKSLKIRPEREYRIIVQLDVKGKWIEGSSENDELSFVFSVSSEPEEEPIWSGNWFPVFAGASAMILSLVVFLYLMRKKL
jgi:hypothetical protein